MNKFLTDAAVLGIGLVGGVYVALPLFQAEVGSLNGFILSGQVSSDGPMRMPGDSMPGGMPSMYPTDMNGGGNVGGYPYQAPPPGMMDGPGMMYSPEGYGGVTGGGMYPTPGMPFVPPMMDPNAYSSEGSFSPDNGFSPAMPTDAYGSDQPVDAGMYDNAAPVKQETGFEGYGDDVRYLSGEDQGADNSQEAEKIQALELRIQELEQKLREAESRAMQAMPAQPMTNDMNTWNQPMPSTMPMGSAYGEATDGTMAPVAMPDVQFMHGAPTAKPVEDVPAKEEAAGEKEGGLWGFLKSLFNRY